MEQWTQSNQTAILIFARSVGLDLARRGWPRSMAGLLGIPLLGCCFEEADVHLFTSPEEAAALAGERGLICHLQRAGSFSSGLAAAVEELAAAGYSRIVVVGRDCPELSAQDVRDAIHALSGHRLALGPDHKGGVYLIGFHARDRQLLKRVKWRRNTDCRQLLELFGPVESFLLPVKQDLDDLGDLRLLTLVGGPCSRLAAAAWRLLTAHPPAVHRVAPPRQADSLRVGWQLPPPLTHKF